MKTMEHSSENILLPDGGAPEVSTDHEEAEKFEYHILTDGRESTGEWVSGEKLRMDYLRTTDALTRKITQGAEVLNPTTGEVERKPYTTLVFLDKSGRPVSHFVRETWPVFAKDTETGEVPPLPAIKFLNIDRRQWIDEIDPNGAGVIDVDRLQPSVIWALRSIHLTPAGKKQVAEDGLTQEVESMPATLDNETILVIDETHYSGDTLRTAVDLLNRAFPTAHVDSAYWLREKVNGKNRNPRWYDDSTSMGRGVNERYTEIKNPTESLEDEYHRRFGRFFLGSPHWNRYGRGAYVSTPKWFTEPSQRDEGYYQLVREVKEVASNPDVPVMPSYGREDMDERLVAYNYRSEDITQFSDEQKEAAIQEVIARKRAVEEDSVRRSRL